MEIFIEFGRKNIRVIMLEEAPSQDSVSAIFISHFQKIIQFIIVIRLLRRKLYRLQDLSNSRPHGFDVRSRLLSRLFRSLPFRRCRRLSHHMATRRPCMSNAMP